MEFVRKNMRASANPMVAGFLSFALILGFSSIVFAAPGETRAWRLHYTRAETAPSNCPSEDDLRTLLAARTNGEDPFKKDAARAISVEIRPTAKEIEARIVARDENGNITTNSTPHVASWRCDQLAEHIVFVLRDIVYPLELPAAKETSESPEKAAKTTELSRTEPTPTASSAPQLGTSPRRSSTIPNLALSLAIGPAWWNAPDTSLSATTSIEAQWNRISVGIEGRYDHAWTVPNMRNATAARAGAVFVACVRHLFAKKLFVRGCGVGEFAQLFVEDQEKTASIHTPPVAVVDIGTRVGVGGWFLPSYGLELRADAAYSIRRPQVLIEGEQIWRARPFTGALRVAFLGVFDVF